MLIGKQSIGYHHINDNDISKDHPKEDTNDNKVETNSTSPLHNHPATDLSLWQQLQPFQACQKKPKSVAGSGIISVTFNLVLMSKTCKNLKNYAINL